MNIPGLNIKSLEATENAVSERLSVFPHDSKQPPLVHTSAKKKQ